MFLIFLSFAGFGNFEILKTNCFFDIFNMSVMNEKNPFFILILNELSYFF